MEQPLYRKLLLRENRNYIALFFAILFVLLAMTIGRNEYAYVASVICVIMMIIFAILNTYANVTLFSIDSYITLTIGFFSAFSVLVILPLDASNTIVQRNLKDIEKNKSDQDFYHNIWTILYWGSMIISALIFNAQRFYHMQGHLFLCSKIIATIKLLALLIIPVVIFIGIIMLIVALTTDLDGFDVIKGVILLCSNIYGITILVLLFGYGLIQFPIYLWNLTDRKTLLYVNLSQSEMIFKNYRETKVELYEISGKMKQIIDQIPNGHELYPYREQLLQEIPDMDDLRQYGGMGKINKDKKGLTKDMLWFKYLKTYQCDKIFEICEPETLKIHERSNSINLNETSKALKMAQQLKQEGDSIHIKIIPIPIWKAALFKISSIFLLCVSIIIIFSETVLVFSEYNDILPFQEIVKKSTNKAGLVCFFFLLLCYIFYCTYFALFKMDLGSFFSLYHEHTHHMTLIFCNKVCLTLVFALCYNFLLLFGQIEVYSSSESQEFKFRNGFDLFFEPMKKIPFFGTYYNLIVTLLIAIVAILSLFRGIKELIQKVSRNNIKFTEHSKAGAQLREGETLVAKEWQKRQKKERLNSLINRTNNIMSPNSLNQNLHSQSRNSQYEMDAISVNSGGTNNQSKPLNDQQQIEKNKQEEIDIANNLRRYGYNPKY